MPNVRREPKPEDGMKRAADFSESFMAIPGYADDTMLFIVRYVSDVQTKLRKVDFEAFMSELEAMDKAAKAAAETPAARLEKVKEHRQKAYAMIEEFPQLTAEFDTFLAKSKRFHREQRAADEQEANARSA